MASIAPREFPMSVSRATLVLMATLGALLFLAFVVFRVQGFGALMPMMLVVAMCMGVLVVLRPAIGLVALVFSAAFVRFSISTGTDSALVVSLLCAVLLIVGWVTHRLVERQPLILLPRRISIPAAILAAATLISFLWGRLTLDHRIVVPETFYRVQIGQALLTLVSLGLLFVSADLLRNRSLRNFIMYSFLGVGALALPIRWFGWDVQNINTAGLFGLWFVALAWSSALTNDELPRWVRISLAALACGWLAMSYIKAGSWVSGWLPAVIAILIITLIAKPRIGIALTLSMIVGLTFYFSILYNVLVTTQEQEGSLGGDFGRLQLIQRNLELIQEHLLVGTGPAGYALYYVTFAPDRAMSTHNNYVDILSQNGIAGLVGFVALLFGLGMIALRLVPRVTHTADRTLAIAIAGGVPGLIFSLWLGDWLIPFVYNQTIAGFDHAVYSWLMLSCLCGLYAQYRREGETHA